MIIIHYHCVTGAGLLSDTLRHRTETSQCAIIQTSEEQLHLLPTHCECSIKQVYIPRQDSSKSLYHHKVGLWFYALLGNATLIDFNLRETQYAPLILLWILFGSLLQYFFFSFALNMFLLLFCHENVDITISEKLITNGVVLQIIYLQVVLKNQNNWILKTRLSQR